MPIINLVYEAPDIRRPGANTVAYYPFSTDYSDKSGNSPTATANNTVIGIYQGVSCLNPNGSYARINNINNLHDLSAYTISAWVYLTGAGGFAIQYTPGGAWGGSGPEMWTSKQGYLRYGNEINMEPRVPALSTGWSHRVQTLTIGGEGVWYVNSVVKNTISNGTAPNNGTYLNIGYNWAEDARNSGYISNLIIERKARTAQEVSDYYNLTKGNYGL